MRSIIITLLSLTIGFACNADTSCIEKLEDKPKVANMFMQCAIVNMKGLQNLIRNINYHTQLNSVEQLIIWQECHIMNYRYQQWLKECENENIKSNKQ